MPDEGKRTVHPGSYCSIEGETGQTKTGTPMVCAPKDGAAVRPRWRRNGPPPPRTGRRRKAAGGSAAVAPPQLADATKIAPIDLTPATPVELPLEAKPTTEEKATVPDAPKTDLVDVTKLLDTPPRKIAYGTFNSGPGYNQFHGSGRYGRTIDSMGDDGRIDMGGQPLRDVIGDIGSDVALQKLHPQDAIDRLRGVAERLPQGSSARRKVDQLIGDIDVPMTPMPKLPDNTPAPLVQLVRHLHAIPACRREGAPELPLAVQAAESAAAGRSLVRIERSLDEIPRKRHESDSDVGKHHIITAVSNAAKGVRVARRIPGQQ